MNKRVRASTPRTKSGCANCRQRRIKCDEVEPACQRCTRSGWMCPGYSVAQTGLSSTAPTSDARTSTSNPAFELSGITQYSLPFKVPGSQDERRALHYFSNFAAADLTGYLPSDFWTRTILQRCQNDVPVRHAAAALGRLHIEYTCTPESATFTGSQGTADAYQRSVKALRTYLGRQTYPDRAVVLMCSAVFYCFELMRGDLRTAIRHLQSGLDILSEWNSEPHASDERDKLIDVFARMDLQASTFDEGRPMVLNLDSITQRTRQLMSSKDAQQTLFPLLHAALAFLVETISHKFSDPHAIPETVLVRRATLLNIFDIWGETATALEQTMEPKAEERAALSEARLHHHAFKLLLLHSLQDCVHERAPTFDDEADRLLDLARDSMFPNPDSCQGPKRSFSLRLGIVAPLFLLATKTLRPRVREAAVCLLQAADGRREGFYDARQIVNLITTLAAASEASAESEVGKADIQNVAASERPRSLQPHPCRTRALEWIVDDVTSVEHYEDEMERWRGFDRLLALVVT